MADTSWLTKVRQFFSHNSTRGEVTMAEYTQFYKQCSPEEKIEMQNAIAHWDGKTEFILLEVQPATEEAAVTSVAA